MKSEGEHRAGHELETAADIAKACDPRRVAPDPQLGLLHAEIAIGYAILAWIDEAREARRVSAQAVLTKCECGGATSDPRQTHVIVL